MKTLNIFLLASVAPLMVGNCMAGADDRHAVVQARVTDRFDRNDDGQLNKRERSAAMNHREKVVDRFDKNDDGKLGKRERKALRTVRSKKG